MEEKTKIWAHRGASGHAPENTLEAFRKAVKMKADGVELDIQMSGDGELVVIHDETLDRVSGEHGFVKDYSLKELKKLNVSRALKHYDKKTRIPTLQEVFELLENTELTINVELKNGLIEYPGMEEKLLRLAEEMKLKERIWCSSFNHRSVQKIKGLCPEMKCGLLFSDIMVNPAAYGRELGIEALHPAVYHFAQDREYIAEAHKCNLAVHIWTVNEKKEMKKLVRAGADALITNYPDIARKAMEQA